MKRKHICMTKVMIVALLGAALAACPTDSEPSKPSEPGAEPVTENIDPTKTYIKFQNPNPLLVILYTDSARQNEFARVPAKGSALVEAEPNPSAVFYIRFQFIAQNGPSLTMPVHERMVNTITFPLTLSTLTVTTAEEMAAVLALFNSEEYASEDYAEWTVALADSFSVGTLALSDRSSNAVLTITSEGVDEKTFSLASLTIGSGVSVVLEENVTLEGLDKGNRLVQIGSGGAFTMKAGSKVHGNAGGGVYVSGGTFTLEGGEISGNSTSSPSYGGGGVYVDGGAFTMSGGTISGNSTSYSAGYGGGGVYVRSGGAFTMSGGTISGNSSGVYVNGSTFTMSNGTISGNSDGGGVYVRSGGAFTMNGGAISGNSYGSGGGVYMYGGTFMMNGGEISGNTASSTGGGVYVVYGSFTMSDGTISGNTASSAGGGVYVGYETFTMSDGTISSTFTKQSGGVIYGSDGGSLKNSAANGPAVYVYKGVSYYRRNSTAGEGVTLNSAKGGSAGGWE